jgi:ribose 5-phosphate isomerase B
MVSENEIRAVVSRVVDELDGTPEPTGGEVPGPQRGGSVESVAVGADHGGWELKERLAAHLRDRGFEVSDCGTHGPESVDYPDFAHAVARRVASGGSRWGVIVDGAGIGSAMVANKVPGVRAALCYDLSSARNSREHNHANVLTLGAGLIGAGLARQIVDAWLATPWGEGRHARRVAMIDEVERRYLRSDEAVKAG